MSIEYSNKKIKEALKLCNGNIGLARKQIVSIAMEDEKLLRALVCPHLDGIVAYQVERVASGRADKPKDAEPMEAVLSSDNETSFGMDILKAVVADDVSIFGRDENRYTGKRKAASKQHIEAIHKMAQMTRNKRTK